MCHGSLRHNIYVCHEMKFYLTKDKTTQIFEQITENLHAQYPSLQSQTMHFSISN